MTSTTDAMPQSQPTSQADATAAASSVRPFYWSVRRELWENAAVWRGPLIAAAVMIFGMLVGAVSHPQVFVSTGGADLQLRTHNGMPLEPLFVRMLPYAIATVGIMFTGGVIGMFYCLGALNGERRDRSILFWKSLPVSDLTTVLAKAVIPLVVLPVCVTITIIVTHLIMLALHAAGLAAHGEDAGALLGQLPLLKLWLVATWGAVAYTLWWAPIWGWLLMVSAWAKRMPILWAILPPFAVPIFERIAFNTSYSSKILSDRFGGASNVAFRVVHPHANAMIDLPNPDPIGFLTTPGLWIGLLIGAAFLAAAVWLRRRADPI